MANEILNQAFENNSGQGTNAFVPDIVAKKFNWGAFLLSWIWGLGNRSFLTLIIFPAAVLGFIPIIGGFIPLGLAIWFGIKGNTWAWQNKQWNSVEEFHSTQKKWAIGGVLSSILFHILTIAIVVALMLPSLTNKSSQRMNEMRVRRAINTARLTANMNIALETQKCTPTSIGLAEWFESGMKNVTREGNKIKENDLDLSEWTFIGNGTCAQKGDCYVKILFKPDYKNGVIIPLYIDEKGNVEIKQEDVDALIAKTSAR